MAGSVEIVNMALLKLGHPSINSLDEDSLLANSAKAIYGQMRDSEIQNYNWSFAKKYVDLPALLEAPIMNFKYAYKLPSNFLKLMHVGQMAQYESPTLPHYATSPIYDIVEGNIYINVPPTLKVVYIASITDEAMFPAAFKNVLACRLAMEFARLITGSTTIKQDLERDYERLIKVARRINALELPSQRPPSGSWLSVRYR